MNESQAKTLIKLMREISGKLDRLTEQAKAADRYVDVAEIAERLGVSADFVYRRVKTGEIPAYKVCGKIQMLESEFAAVLPKIS
ncbi:MAG: helix-turn-helix domain-containing protein [Muribaculaceae bacterium]|nr:helix-turn-helix domain-containing protein [Muribaculaceae bacterium]